MFKATLSFKCDCGSLVNVILEESEVTEKSELHLSESIEQNSNGLIYCHQGYEDGMDIICVICGESTKLLY